MQDRKAMQEALDAYATKSLAVACIASHSGLDVYDGAADEGLRSIAVAQRGRDAVYARYFRTLRDGKGRRVRGCVDDVWTYPRYDGVMAPAAQARLRKANAIWVPNRSWTSYCSMSACEDFAVPMFGSRRLLHTEDREAVASAGGAGSGRDAAERGQGHGKRGAGATGGTPAPGHGRDYYWLLEQAGLPFPRKIASPDDIDRLAIVKLHHAKKSLERGFFTCASPKEFRAKASILLRQGVIDKESLAAARIEEYVIGPVFNLNFFYSPVSARSKEAEPLELLGVDWRFESSLDGHVRIPAPQQMSLPPSQKIPEMTVVGHNTATIRESLLGEVFRLGETWVKAAREHYAPGIIGPFCLQTCLDKDMKFWIYDVAPRIGGGTNVHVATGHPYGNALWRTTMSTGRRIAVEIQRAAEADRLADVVT